MTKEQKISFAHIAEFRQAIQEKFERATGLEQFFMIAELARTKARNAAKEIAISDIFTASVKAEEAAETANPIGVLATIHAIYEEFEPETMKGFDVKIGGRIERFDHLNDAEFYAHCNADRVARASSVDHYLFDKSFVDTGNTANTAAVKHEEAADGDDTSVDIATIRDDAVKTLRDLMNDDYVPHTVRADIAKYVIESRIG